MAFKVLITDHAWPTTEPEQAVLRDEVGAESIVAPDASEETLVSLATDVDAIMTCFAQVTPAVLQAATKCVAVGRFGVGFDNIAVDTATELGMAVTYVPDYCVDEVSDHVMALLLTWNRRVALLDNSVKTTGWGSVPLTMRIMRLRGKTLGIIGFGRIGKSVCEKARAFGLDILVSDPYVSAEIVAERGARMVDMDTLLSESEFVSLHSPLTDETHNLISSRELELMKSDAFLVNCARGPLIDESALYDGLTSGQIAGAGLDVMVDAVPPPGTPLLGLDNIIITPHTAFFSQEATLELEQRAAREVCRVLKGEMPENLVNPDVLKHPNPRHSLPSATE
ncbi:MAG: C-terminal binding protein [SAR202 cluster bacterium]|jgi:D-3-phosphoglycerate dehydrogenase|nr:C-terminal binding protein [SAR202 cluster bacterium]MDP7103272.1 C-terminal binding protein [SAR202 cluster bacterium]MDP7224813.1 C-terminal binding protein [SAR202 cluster bacterium]MDP7412716.1 C-terminal binding protein [SAR202 cluster bacterium]HJO83390.1 C-terminal binding protein [SAR202 cluster bacterium]|tara:strand:- start:1135 stop:2148 length:1014 start_codon:yes stop_codon:yes gene_type:complete